VKAWGAPVGNLSPRAATKRLRQALVMLALTLAAAVVLAKTGVAAPWRIALALPMFVVANGFYQALYRT
jgi:hypothetical protein